MIRALLIALGVCVGLGMAVLTSGSTGHLRALPGVSMPTWAETLDDESTLSAGSATLPRLPLAAGPADLEWRLAGIAPGGARYRLRLRARGLDLSGVARLSIRRVFLEVGNGLIDLSALDLLRAAGIGGVVRVDDAEAAIATRAPYRPDLTVVGEVAGLTLDDHLLGDGPVRIESDADGNWRLTVDTRSEGGRFRVTAAGAPDNPMATVDWTLETETDLPAHLAQRLARTARRRESGWLGQLAFATGL